MSLADVFTAAGQLEAVLNGKQPIGDVLTELQAGLASQQSAITLAQAALAAQQKAVSHYARAVTAALAIYAEIQAQRASEG